MSTPAATRPSTLYLLHTLTYATRSDVDEALRPQGISAFQYTILTVLARNEGLSSSKLSRRFHVTPQTMGETIALLERKGLIARAEDEGNRRVLLLRLTPEGNQATLAAADIVEDIERKVLAPLSATELASFRAMITRLNLSLRDNERAE